MSGLQLPYLHWRLYYYWQCLDAKTNMVDSPCVPSRPPFFIGVILRFFPLRAELFPPDGLLLPQGRQCSVKFVTPLWACVLQGGVHGIDGFLPGNVSAVYLRDFGVGAYLIVADALFLIILPVAGGHGGGVISTKAADIHIDGATTCTGYVARGIAGKDAASDIM